jgi:hypothetical protein
MAATANIAICVFVVIEDFLNLLLLALDSIFIECNQKKKKCNF